MPGHCSQPRRPPQRPTEITQTHPAPWACVITGPEKIKEGTGKKGEEVELTQVRLECDYSAKRKGLEEERCVEPNLLSTPANLVTCKMLPSAPTAIPMLRR